MAELSIATRKEVMGMVTTIATAAASSPKMGWNLAGIKKLVETLYPTMVKLIEQGGDQETGKD